MENMTYGELKLKCFFDNCDSKGIIMNISPKLYFAVVEIANECGCGKPADRDELRRHLGERSFGEESICAVLGLL